MLPVQAHRDGMSVSPAPRLAADLLTAGVELEQDGLSRSAICPEKPSQVESSGRSPNQLARVVTPCSSSTCFHPIDDRLTMRCGIMDKQHHNYGGKQSSELN